MKKLKYKKILFFIIICICFFLTDKYIVKADTYSSKEFTAQLYDNYGPTLSAVTTNNTGSYWTGYIPTMVANSAGSAWGISSPIPLLANHTYTLSLNPGSYIGNTVLSTYNRIGIGTTMANAKSSYENGGVTVNYSKALGNGYIQYAFSPSSAGSFIVIPFSTDISGNDVRFDLYNLIIEDLGSVGVSQADINNSLNNHTNIIQNSINDMSQDIQNGIKDNFNDCYSNLLNPNLVDVNGSLGFNVSNLKIGKKYIFTSSVSVGALKFASSLDQADGSEGPQNWDRYITSWIFEYTGNPYLFILNNDTMLPLTQEEVNNYHLQISEGTTAHSYIPYGQEKCQNKIDETNKNIKDVNDTLKDDNIDTSKTTIEDKSADASKSPISSLLTLPLKLLNNIHTGLSGTCSSLSLGSLFGTELVLPCINLEQRLGSYLWGLIDYAFCIFLIYNVGMLAVKIWTDVIMMRDFFSELYKPQGEKGGKDK